MVKGSKSKSAPKSAPDANAPEKPKYGKDAEIEMYMKAAVVCDPSKDLSGFKTKLAGAVAKAGIQIDEKKLKWWLGERRIAI